MPLTVGVPKETAPGETRVALVPDVVRRLTGSEVNVVVEEGAGAGAYHTDDDYAGAGARVGRREEALGADVVAVVSPPPEQEIQRMSEGHVLVGLLDPLGTPATIRQLADAGVTALAMELVPRISRAQKMDVLSAMSSLAGYRAALIGAHALPRFFPLLTTAAGTIRPAQVLVLGAGVAGLQALATAKRLGARVSGYDIREATREEVESLGAEFVELELDIAGEGEGGYAKELQQEKQERQPELLLPHIAEADVVISTALIPGRPAPLLISEDAVAAMGAGSAVIDLAATGGGNCALTQPGETVVQHGTKVFGPTNLPAAMPVSASQLYARTVAALIQEFIDEEEGTFASNFDDDIFAGACVAHQGEVRNDRVRDALGLEAQEHGRSEERARAGGAAGRGQGGGEERAARERGEGAPGQEPVPEAGGEKQAGSPPAPPVDSSQAPEPDAPEPDAPEPDAPREDRGEPEKDEDKHEEWKPPGV